jgi:murein DD-endopeptidase MepM/ murein hydrolase activator NlpD
MDVDYVRPCKTRVIRDDFADHVARGSVLPGLDYACNTGDEVYATAAGKVVNAENVAHDVRGISVEIRHADGRRSHYLHLFKLKCRTGDRVEAGQLIGLAGNTGTTSSGAHLHFAIQDKSGKALDPAKILRKELKEKRAEKAAAAAVVVPPVAEVVPE